jgi:hypothetical protein
MHQQPPGAGNDELVPQPNQPAKAHVGMRIEVMQGVHSGDAARPQQRQQQGVPQVDAGEMHDIRAQRHDLPPDPRHAVEPGAFARKAGGALAIGVCRCTSAA